MWSLPKNLKQAQSILNANRRLNIWDGSIRSGKTVCSLIAWYSYLTKFLENSSEDRGINIITGVTMEAILRNILIPLSEWLPVELFSYAIGKRRAYIMNGKKTTQIFLIGGNDIQAQKKIRGATIYYAYCDELSLYPYAFWLMILRGLSLPGSRLYGTTNPDSPRHWLKTDVIDNNLIEKSYFHFTLEDNPFLEPDYIKNIKNEFSGLFYKRFIEGLWVAASGAAYSMFDESKHVIDTKPFLGQCYQFYISIDVGYVNPCTFGLYGTIGDKIYLFAEYYWDSLRENQQKTAGEYAEDLKLFIKDNLPLGQNIIAICVDPSATPFINEIEKQGYTVKLAGG